MHTGSAGVITCLQLLNESIVNIPMPKFKGSIIRGATLVNPVNETILAHRFSLSDAKEIKRLIENQL